MLITYDQWSISKCIVVSICLGQTLHVMSYTALTYSPDLPGTPVVFLGEASGSWPVEKGEGSDGDGGIFAVHPAFCLW